MHLDLYSSGGRAAGLMRPSVSARALENFPCLRGHRPGVSMKLYIGAGEWGRIL